MAKVKDPRLQKLTSEFVASLATEGAQEAKKQSTARKRTPASAAQADDRPGESYRPPSPMELSGLESDPSKIPPPTFQDALDLESTPNPADQPALPTYRFEDDPAGLKSLYQRILRRATEEREGGPLPVPPLDPTVPVHPSGIHSTRRK